MARLVIALLLVLAGAGAAAALTLAAQKDQLFAYPGILSSGDGGDFLVVDYNEARDINRRDDIPERRVKARYLSLGVRREQQDLTLATAAGPVSHVAVGRTANASLIVVYLHGQGGSRKQGVDDFTFGGNFNRIKNLWRGRRPLSVAGFFRFRRERRRADRRADRALRPSLAGGAGLRRLRLDGWRALLGARQRPGDRRRLGGLLLLGSHWDDDYLESQAFRRRVPMFLATAAMTPSSTSARQEAFYRQIREKAPGYPVRFVRFETGTHGTPIRMTDWRGTLNWMLSLSH